METVQSGMSYDSLLMNQLMMLPTIINIIWLFGITNRLKHGFSYQILDLLKSGLFDWVLVQLLDISVSYYQGDRNIFWWA